MGKDLKGKELGTGITQRKDGTYQARFIDRWGKRQTIYGKDLKLLRKDYAKCVADNERKLNVKEQLTLDDWFTKWLEVYKNKSVRPNTKREYVHIYNKSISPYLGSRKINELVKSDIQQVVDRAYDSGYLYERQNKIRLILRDMLQRAIEDHLIVSNPVSGIKVRSEKEISARALTVSEQQIFLEFCTNTFYENLFQVALNTGLRPGELFALQVSDIDFENGLINVDKTLVYQKYLTDTKKEFHVEPPKTKQSYRKVPINSVCKKYLLRQIEQKKIVETKQPKEFNSYLFTTKYNTPLNSVILSDAIKSVIRQINLFRTAQDKLEFFSGHTFRHTFATRCLEAGVAPKVVQAILGHASLKMTMDLYTHVTEDKAIADIERIVPDSDNMVLVFPKKMA
ncbi:MAG: tyrosine-type recombinase/integrase [Lachnospiraceae bacterium]|nr:tyrosine-type recombinase/integrase [Lachnospiraceae bacterium]